MEDGKKTADAEPHAASDTQQKQLLEWLENYKTVIAEQYKGAVTYTNVVIFAGYAAYFTVLSYAHEMISHKMFAWSVLLMMISAISFVFFEVYKMAWTALSIRRQSRALEGRPDQAVRQIIVVAQTIERHATIFVRIWIFSLIVSVLPSLAAIGLLAYGLLLIII